ncbi:AhpC/TSA family protein [Flavobacterium sp. ZT3R18]|uniref:AhpC/TSA family protein n=1 Tax=Flavobacterium sp. ZT3R18 TaxID=2594429 RepID=UPI00117B885A|nr:AhpC/TSA family protein [Flavobacterium sp. ZT3R18]TRX35864.1 AhpC/TSA family protein [Flavobacterium sp. ZT3R18]
MRIYQKSITLVTLLLFLSCKENLKSTKEDIPYHAIDKIDLFMGSTPKKIIAKTLDGSVFNSKEHTGKYLVIFIYDKGYLKKSESYDMVEELNTTYKDFKNKIHFIGIIKGFIESKKELNDLVSNSKIDFKQIDNTKSYKKNEKLDYNIFCSPAKIIISPEGKVIYSACGGKTETLNYKLDSIANRM